MIQYRRKHRSRCHLNIYNLGKISIGLTLFTLIVLASGQDPNDENPGNDAVTTPGLDEPPPNPENPPDMEGGGAENQTDPEISKDPLGFLDGRDTTHERLGQPHFPFAILTPYNSTAVYARSINYSSWLLHPAYNITHGLLKMFLLNNDHVPAGYIIVKNETTLSLGRKVEQNDWADLLAEYPLVYIWVILMLIAIILIPFIGVCYCCFCCCRRCTVGCPPCDGPKDKRKSLICGALLAFLLLLIILGLLITFYGSRLLDREFDETGYTIQRGTSDTCTFLRDVSENVYHVFVYNYEETQAQMNDIINEAASHITLDLADSSESNAVAELERILDNMREAKQLLTQVDKLEKELRYNAAMLRDSLRGVKRTVNFVCTVLISHNACDSLLRTTQLQSLDESICLHLDKVPNTEKYVEGVQKILDSGFSNIPKRALLRFQEIDEKVSAAMDLVKPALRTDVDKGREMFNHESEIVRLHIDHVISDIHYKTIDATTSFEDIHDKYDKNRAFITGLACFLILVIILVLIVALICGCCFNKSFGASCLLAAIILIFCVFSFITLMALFYYIIGIVAYQGACAPLYEDDANALIKKMDASLNLHRQLPPADITKTPVFMSQTIETCKANESIFSVLQEHGIYDPTYLREITVLPMDANSTRYVLEFREDLSKVFLLTKDEKEELRQMRNTNLSDYHSIMFLENMCKQISPNLDALADKMLDVSTTLYTQDSNWKNYNRMGIIALRNEAMQLRLFDEKYAKKVLQIMDRMHEKLIKIDQLILSENRNFNHSIDVLVKAIVRSEDFIRNHGNHYVNYLGANLTAVLLQQIDAYVENVIYQSYTCMGRCGPLASVYHRGVDDICYRLVDPFNVIWFGLLICAICFLILLFLLHHLMCLWKRLHSSRVVPVPIIPLSGCPTCTGAPYRPPPIITCSNKLRSDGGGTAASSLQLTEDLTDENNATATEKPKKD